MVPGQPSSGKISPKLDPLNNYSMFGTTVKENKTIRLYVPVQLFLTNGLLVDTLAFVDSGVDCSLIDKALVKEHMLEEQQLSPPITFEVIDGHTLPSGTSDSYVNCSLKINNKSVDHKFYTLDTPRTSLVLGLDWLRKFNPSIDWELLKLSFPDENDSMLNISSKVIGQTTIQSTEQKDVPIDNPAELDDQFQSESDKLEEIHRILPKVYHDFSSVFFKHEAELLPEHQKYNIAIILQDSCKIPWGPIYSLSDPKLETLCKYIDEQLAKGFIRPSTSPAGASLFFVKKKNGELHPVIDYRALNNITVKNRYPLPLINEMLNRFAHAKIFSKIDLRGAYNLVRIREGDEWKTAFCCRFGHYEYRVMPFGLTNAPAVFQCLMNDILREYLDIFCVVYLDDILIFSESPEEHVVHVKKVLSKLRENHLYAKLEKCAFAVREVDFLGYTISDTGIAMDQRVTSIQTWPTPANIKELQSFLGFTNFYCMFIAYYTKIALPLFNLLKKNVEFIWSDQCSEAFVKLNEAFVSASLLKHPDTSKPFVIETDASDFALGGILSQYHNDILCPVAFYSRKMTSAEINYEIHDKELLAIIVCFYQWRPLLLSNFDPIIVYTDHRNLLYFSEAKKLNRHQARWSLFLSKFNFKIVYRAGKEGGKPDALSRQPDYTLSPQDERVKAQSQVLLPREKFLIGSTISDKESYSLLD